ncbi:divergent polysaccharide deacetylase family protein [Chelatococcus sambhunathii]|uniref:Divergent polysaccharide deacetylase family protein n=1 Tax=Chelatococcus sambhunathii TaxID=363953 RepID=A0ABU1DF59_9HYPH|nr:divergent polysaccharide deacetylase family protein [Chelatococcus sambhunathii]MDR4306751.1 divergent polysaccharide deacetylase family protein [Chelatococcus sambhunathii]
MADQDLEKPLRTREPARKVSGRLLPNDGVGVVAGVVIVLLLIVAGWAVLVRDPLGGEPTATATIERRAPARPGGGHGEEKAAEAKAETSRDGVPIVNPGEPVPKAGPVIIRVPGANDGGSGKAAGAPSGAPGAVQTAMLEDSKFGPLPRIAADGKRPMDAYARPQAAPRQPRVALVVAGLGVGKEATAEAVKSLPGEVTLAFSPYGSDVAEQIAGARRDGHETLIQAPMEPFAYPSNDPGPQTLLTTLPASANLERLRWTLGRASGYVGVAPLAGARFLQSDDALAPIFTELARRGLMFVAQGQQESRFATLAEQSGLPALRTSAPIDATPDAAAIDGALADLERDAKASGAAIGLASATPLTLKRIEAWRAGLAKRGVALVPLTAALKPQGPS